MGSTRASRRQKHAKLEPGAPLAAAMTARTIASVDEWCERSENGVITRGGAEAVARDPNEAARSSGRAKRVMNDRKEEGAGEEQHG